ncbi:MAG: right-handed parallel beta-helix repeat-containing protein, partial [Chloroflexota bacterium]
MIAAITTANANGQDDVIDLGGQTFTLTAVNNTTNGSNGLPVLLADGGHTLTISNGTIERQGAAPAFRLVHIGSGAHVTFDQVTLRSGLASIVGLGTLGGAIYMDSATVSITRSRLTSNTATTGSGLGGAIFNNRSTLNISHTTFSGNVGEGGGGGVYAYSTPGSTTVVNSVFENNTSDGFGGAVSIELAAVTIINSTISNNVATNAGGGVYALGGSLTLAHATLSGNSAMTGGGLFNESCFSGVVTLRATIRDSGTTGAICGGTGSAFGSNRSSVN